MTTQIQLRRDTAANWTTINPTLALGEPGYETDTNKLKIGDGVHAWQDLDYLTNDNGNIASTGDIAFNNGIIYNNNDNASIYIDPSNDSGNTGSITVPGPADADSNALAISNQMNGGVQIDSGSNSWAFDSDGALSVPGSGTIRNQEGPVNLVATDYAQLQWTTPTGAGEANPNDTNEPKNWVYVESGGVFVETNINTGVGDTRTWQFDNSGVLHLPVGGDIVDSDGNSVLGGVTTVGPMYVVANTDGNIIYSTNGTTFSAPFNTGIGSIGTVAIGPGLIVYSRLDVNGDSDASGLYSTTAPDVQPTLISGTDGSGDYYFTQVKYFEGAPQPWVAVGVSTQTSPMEPIIMYSSNGVTWTETRVNAGDLAGFFAGDSVDLRFTDIQYAAGGYLISADRNNSFGNKGGGLWWTTNITNELTTGQNWVDVNANFKAVESFANSFFSKWQAFSIDKEWWGNNDATPDTTGSWNNFGTSIDEIIRQETGLSGQTLEESTSGLSTPGDYIWATSSGNGHIVWWSNVPDGPYVSIPAPYTSNITDIMRGTTTTITIDNGLYTADGEKVTISGVTSFDAGEPGTSQQDYNGTYYIKFNNGMLELYTNQELTTPWDTTTFWPPTLDTGTLTWSHGQYIDALGFADGHLYCANDDEEVYRGTFANYNTLTWTKVNDLNNSLMYWNTIGYYGSFVSGGNNTLTSGDKEVVLNSDGSITFPTLTGTGWFNGYSISGPTLQMGNDPTVGEVIITGPAPNNANANARRMIIQGQKGHGGEFQNKGEGGDVYIWAGVGGDAGAVYGQGDGGDIKIRGGQGGSGGYVKIEGGDSTANGSTGGHIEINAGSNPNTNGNGGDVTIRAGDGNPGAGGNNGEVHIYTVDGTNHWRFDNGGTLHLPTEGDIVDSNGASVLGGGGTLTGNGYTGPTGHKFKVYCDWQGGQGGEADGQGNEDWFSYTPNIAVGDLLVFFNGAQRTVTSVTQSAPEHTVVQWNGSPVIGGWNAPRYPILVVSQDYDPGVKNTAKIKPDTAAANDWDQYMDIYVGQNSELVDSRHVHMKGHTEDVELFLGTDNNYVSVKDAGAQSTRPASVNLHSENDVTVTDSNLRLKRKGSSWVSIYGDGENRNLHYNTNDLAWNVITTDDDGNYYVGGEATNEAEAIVSKFGRDGNLIWSKYVNGYELYGWQIDGIAYGNGEVATAVMTNNAKNYDYYKVTIHDSVTGEIKSTTDVYDEQGHLEVSSMTYHPDMGWVLVGNSNGEEQATGAINGVGATGTDIIELASSDAQIGGMYPDTNTWKISGTGIVGDQTIGTGVGMFRSVPITTVTGIGSGATVTIVKHYNTNSYELFGVDLGGQDYATGDQVKILGSALDGLDGGTSLLLTPQSWSVESGTARVYFSKTTYPDLYDQVNWAAFTASYNANTYNVILIESAGSNWKITLDTSDLPTGAFSIYSAAGNDITFTVVDNFGQFSGSQYGLTGVPNRARIRFDMNYSMGYSGVDFTGGSTGVFALKAKINNTPWVWTSSGISRRLPPDPTIGGYTSGNARCVAVVPGGGLVVAGYISSNYGNAFVWKINANGATAWAKTIVNDGSPITGVTVSAKDGSVYVSNEYTAITKLSGSTGNLIKRAAPSGMWGLDNPEIRIALEDGEEFLYVGGSGGAIWTNQTGFMLSKLTTDLYPVWGKSLWCDGDDLYTNYDLGHQIFALGDGQASIIGYSYIGSNYAVGMMLTLSTIDEEFGTGTKQIGRWHLDQYRQEWGIVTGWSVDDLTARTTPAASDVSTSLGNGDPFTWTNYAFQSGLVKLNTTENGIKGVETIEFADGGVLDHNPAIIPPIAEFDRDYSNEYTLKLSDAGKFISNMPVPNDSQGGDIYVYVPRNDQVAFPVGTVITLINTSSDSASGYRIYVYPTDYSDTDGWARIWATGGNQNPSKWSFQGIQTATLMKISTNGWLLTCNDVTNED